MNADFILTHLTGAVTGAGILVAVLLLISIGTTLDKSSTDGETAFMGGCALGLFIAGATIIGAIWLNLHVLPFIQL